METILEVKSTKFSSLLEKERKVKNNSQVWAVSSWVDHVTDGDHDWRKNRLGVKNQEFSFGYAKCKISIRHSGASIISGEQGIRVWQVAAQKWSLKPRGLMKSSVGWARTEKRKSSRRAEWALAPAHGGYSFQIRGTLLGAKWANSKGPTTSDPKCTPQTCTLISVRANGYRQGGKKPTGTSCHPERVVITSLFQR